MRMPRDITSQRFPIWRASRRAGKRVLATSSSSARTGLPDSRACTACGSRNRPPRWISVSPHALADGKVDVIAGNSTDGQVAALELGQLADDRGYFPPYQAAPVIR